jgi:hypothetical protein
MSRLLVYSVAHCRAWGLDPRCGNVGCNAQIGDVNSQPMRGRTVKTANHGVVKWICRMCKWESPYVSRPEWLHEIAGHDLFFWHAYPLDEEKRSIVATQAS